MKMYDELVARGLIAQVTDEEKVREMVDNGKAVFYIGFADFTGIIKRIDFTFHGYNLRF